MYLLRTTHHSPPNINLLLYGTGLSVGSLLSKFLLTRQRAVSSSKSILVFFVLCYLIRSVKWKTSKMDDDKMLLSWNDFAANVPSTFRQLWADQDFTDVILATEDDQQIKAHKVILSSHSEFFKNLLLKNPHQNPRIYLKGIRHNKLERLLEFIYLGQCYVANEELQDFLTIGTDLKVKGLRENVAHVDMKNHGNQDKIKESNRPQKLGPQSLQREFTVSHTE